MHTVIHVRIWCYSHGCNNNSNKTVCNVMLRTYTYTFRIRSLYFLYTVIILSVYGHYTFCIRSLYFLYMVIILSVYGHYTFRIRSLYFLYMVILYLLYLYFLYNCEYEEYKSWDISQLWTCINETWYSIHKRVFTSTRHIINLLTAATNF